MKCKNCQGFCVKKGCQKRRQKYYCKVCKIYQQKTYTYKRCTSQDDTNIIKLNNIGVSISGISNFTGISKSNVIKRICRLAKQLEPTQVQEINQEYEVDEMHTFIKKKAIPCYITYAINRKTRKVIDFVVGSRTKENLGKVISTVNKLNPKKIFTDKLNIYPRLIEKSKHIASAYKINHIERFNLTLRTHLKRLSRKTICFSKSKAMLEHCLGLYFNYMTIFDLKTD